MKVKSANQAFYRVFQVKQSETENKYFYEIGKGHWAIPKLQDILKGVLNGDGKAKECEIEQKFDRIGNRKMLVNFCKIYPDDKASQLILLSFKDGGR